tara:strand:+ start:117 stop:1601 length:1485 start_codon:yes stop_codon:yes gene_type:complete
MPTNTTYPNASQWTPLQAKTTNITLGSLAQKATGFAVGAIGSLSGIPQVAQIGQSFTNSSENYSPKSAYAVSALNAMKSTNNVGIQYPDFRARKFPSKEADTAGASAALSTKRVDGLAASLRTLLDKTNTNSGKDSLRSGLYSATSISPYGAYSIFNLQTLYGWGDHDNPYALRNDFTAQSHVATQWDVTLENKNGDNPAYYKGSWEPTKNLLSKATPFRGDKVNVIDFSQRNLKDAYRWLPKPKIFGDASIFDKVGTTADLIKFFFTGPKLHAGNTTEEDDIIVFRAVIGSISDSFNASWNGFQLIGRGDQNFQYGGFTRDISIDFTVYATDRDEVKPIWRKLNALAGYTAPEYTDNIALVGPWMRITIGDLFNQQAVLVKSVNYTLHSADTTWETNIEQDPQMMQTPHKVDVNLTLTPITDWLPQKGGKFYSLAKRFDGETGLPLPGNDNWLSDTKNNVELTQEQLKEISERTLFNKSDQNTNNESEQQSQD